MYSHFLVFQKTTLFAFINSLQEELRIFFGGRNLRLIEREIERTTSGQFGKEKNWVQHNLGFVRPHLFTKVFF